MCNHLACDDSSDSNSKVWRPDDTDQPTPRKPGFSQLYRPDILETIEAKIKEMDAELRELSLDIHGNTISIFFFLIRFSSSSTIYLTHPPRIAHPELGYEE